MKNKIKCKFCGWETLSWRTNKKGQQISGYNRLLIHVSLQHEEELEKVRQFSKHFVEAPMKRYVAITDKQNPLDSDILFVEKVPPDTPYYEIEITIVWREKKYAHEREADPCTCLGGERIWRQCLKCGKEKV